MGKDQNMYDYICKTLINNGTGLIYVTNRAIANALERLGADGDKFHYEVSINEKIAFELSLAGAIASKRTACIFSTEGIYEALDPIMSSAYTGVKKGLLIVCIQETYQDATPIGPFSKLPFITGELGKSLPETIEFCNYISERYEIPVILQIYTGDDDIRQKSSDKGQVLMDRTDPVAPMDVSQFIKDPARWAATPSFRYELHRLLNQKTEAIREEFEAYRGNNIDIKGRAGIITTKKPSLDFFEEDTSILNISTIYPLPVKKVKGFIGQMDEVCLLEGEFPVIELQIPDRKKLRTEHFIAPSRIKKHDEDMFGFEVIRDRLGPASSINIAHGIKKLDPHRDILALTYEDHFLHSGMPGFVNTLYNNSSYAILIMTDKKGQEIKGFMDGCGFSNYIDLARVEDLKGYRDIKGLTVFLCQGII